MYPSRVHPQYLPNSTIIFPLYHHDGKYIQYIPITSDKTVGKSSIISIKELVSD